MYRQKNAKQKGINIALFLCNPVVVDTYHCALVQNYRMYNMITIPDISFPENNRRSLVHLGFLCLLKIQCKLFSRELPWFFFKEPRVNQWTQIQMFEVHSSLPLPVGRWHHRWHGSFEWQRALSVCCRFPLNLFHDGLSHLLKPERLGLHSPCSSWVTAFPSFHLEKPPANFAPSCCVLSQQALCLNYCAIQRLRNFDFFDNIKSYPCLYFW